GSSPTLAIEESRSAHPSPYGKVTLSLRMIRQRYIHHSDHYNLLEGLSFGQITRFEFPFDSLVPFRPTSSRERKIHFNLSPE
ncbi:MAG: hypothetical protein ACTHWH_16575, partial [Marinobacter sp.]